MRCFTFESPHGKEFPFLKLTPWGKQREPAIFIWRNRRRYNTFPVMFCSYTGISFYKQKKVNVAIWNSNGKGLLCGSALHEVLGLLQWIGHLSNSPQVLAGRPLKCSKWAWLSLVWHDQVGPTDCRFYLKEWGLIYHPHLKLGGGGSTPSLIQVPESGLLPVWLCKDICNLILSGNKLSDKQAHCYFLPDKDTSFDFGRVVKITVPLSSGVRGFGIDARFPSLFMNRRFNSLVLPPGGHKGFTRLLSGPGEISSAQRIGHPS